MVKCKKMRQENIKKLEDTQHGRFLTFSLGEEVYGIEIKLVREIIGIQKISRLPEVPNYIKGVINLRGIIIPVIDVRLRFNKHSIDYADRACIIVIESEDTSAGLIVDQVCEVVRIDDEQIVPPPEIYSGEKNKFIKAIGRIGDQIKLIINCRKLLVDYDEKSSVENTKNTITL